MDLVSDSDEDVLEVVMVFSVVDLVEFLFLEFLCWLCFGMIVIVIVKGLVYSCLEFCGFWLGGGGGYCWILGRCW